MFKMIRENMKYLFIFVFVLALAGTVSAFGVAVSPADKDGGFTITLQNSFDNSVTFEINDKAGFSLSSGQEYAVESNGFTMLSAQLDPGNFVVGAGVPISMWVTSRPSKDSGETVTLSPGMRISSNVEITNPIKSIKPVQQEEVVDEGSNFWYWVIGLIVLVIIIWFVISRKRR